uniref:Uncharacterized protein n=1 Tax=Cacopsylla melanoneura TaxID=428564 RepID=A0A8D9BYR1_9HEMI
MNVFYKLAYMNILNSTSPTNTASPISIRTVFRLSPWHLCMVYGHCIRGSDGKLLPIHKEVDLKAVTASEIVPETVSVVVEEIVVKVGKGGKRVKHVKKVRKITWD